MLGILLTTVGIVVGLAGVWKLAYDILRGPIAQGHLGRLHAQQRLWEEFADAERRRAVAYDDQDHPNVVAFEGRVTEFGKRAQSLAKQIANHQNERFWASIESGRAGLILVSIGAILQIAGALSGGV